MNRNTLLSGLREKQDFKWDIIVTGGGATGLGIALDAVSRGYSTLLLEQSDFAKATSSRSTKLVHGGVRYMAQGDLFLVMEALSERGRMLKNAPHITFNQEFVIPVYTWWDVFLYTVGLKFYDLLAGRLSLGKSYYINAKKALERLPLLLSKGLKGGIVYHDGQFDDARMAIELARASAERGGVVMNYLGVTGLLKNSSGQIEGVKAKETITGEEFTFKAGLVINATGVFADNVSRMDNPGAKSTLRPSQGVHIVLDRSFLGSDSAIMIPKTDDGRVLFAIPWYNQVVAGTTDTPLDEITLEPVALESEIDFILKTAGRYLVKPPKRSDVLCIFAGLRPLAANSSDPSATKEVSRRHKIILSSSGLLTVVGGKWTTYRMMAEETIDRGIKAGMLDKKRCVTSDLKLSSGEESHASGLNIYGSHASEIEKLISEDPSSGEPLDTRLPYSAAEFKWICRNEMPATLEDLLSRRTRALILNARASSDIAGIVAGIMAEEMGLSQEWQAEQTKLYRETIKNYI